MSSPTNATNAITYANDDMMALKADPEVRASPFDMGDLKVKLPNTGNKRRESSVSTNDVSNLSVIGGN